jgi:acyl dehydratase
MDAPISTNAPPCYDDVGIGDALPPLTLPPVSRLQLALFAAASADPNPIHVDDDAARGSGLPGAIVHGMLTMAFLGRLLTRWVPQRDLRQLSARFVAMAFPGDTLVCSATVTGKAVIEGEQRVELDLVARNQKGDKILLGSATVALP